MQFSTSEACPRRGAGMWLRTIAVAGFSILSIAITVPRAQAVCGQLTGAHPGVLPVPMMAVAPGDPREGRSYDTIVGLWQTVYTSEGALFAESFKQWHADGTELDNIDQNPAVGSLCLGVWEAVGNRGVRLHHVGWLFAPDGTPAGSFVMEEMDTLASDGMSYQGTFVFRTYDTSGNYAGTTVKGTIAASRITVN
jgi:hypothetical protein